MAAKKSTFLDIDPKLIEKNLSFVDTNTDLDKAFAGLREDGQGPWKNATPKPGFCIKTVDKNGKKVFVNFCTLEEIPEPKDVTEDELLELIEARHGDEFRVPLSLQEPREEMDKSGKPTMCFDVAINPRFYKKVEKSAVFKMFIVQVTFDGLKDKFDVDLEVEDYITLKNRKCVGTLQPHRIRTSSKPYEPPKQLIQDVTSHQRNQKPIITEIKSTPRNDLKYTLHKVTRDAINFLYGEVQLPQTILAKDVNLQVGEDRLIVEDRKGGNVLDIFLPVNVDEKNAQAAFASSSRSLHIMVPITA